MKNKKKFGEFMASCGEIFDKEITDSLNMVYWKALDSFSDEECEKAFRSVMATCRFFPKPADLLDILHGDTALKAWLKLDRAIRRIGGSESVQFDDPAIHSAIEAMGGWQSVDDWMENEMTWKQKEFERLYKTVRTRDNHPLYLIGKYEDNNRGTHGAFVKPPILIADSKEGVKILTKKQIRELSGGKAA